MSRGLTTAAEAAITAKDVRPILLYEGEFASGFLRLWTGLGNLTWNSQTWVGAGNLIGVAQISETTDVSAQGTVVSLSGVPTSVISAVIADVQQGLPGRIWLGFLDAAGAVIADPVQSFVGRLDVPEISDGLDACVVRVSYESRLIDLNRPREWRYTHESQQSLHPGDLGFEYVTKIQEMEVSWGRP